MTAINLLKRILRKSWVLLQPTNQKTSFISNSCIDKRVSYNSIKKIKDSTLVGPISIGDHIEIDNSIISGENHIGHHCKLKGCDILGNITIGHYTSLWGPGIVIRQKINDITIGSFCSIAKNVTIQEYNHNLNKVSTYYMGQNFFNEKWGDEVISKGSIIIGNDVWIGEKCTILGGVRLGNGAVIGAGSIVTKSVPDYAIAVGSPAKIIGYRFEPEMIEKLQKLEWWDWDIDKIREHKEFFKNELTPELIKRFIK